MENKKRTQKLGFTLLEMVAVITVLVILAGIVVPIANGVIEDAKVARTLDLVDKLSTACRRFYTDTGARPSALGDLWKAPVGIDGWNGPYVDRPVDNGDSPFEGTVSLTASGANFTLAAASPTQVTKGLGIELNKIPQSAVAKFEQETDQADDATHGQVLYTADVTPGNFKVIFFLMPWTF